MVSVTVHWFFVVLGCGVKLCTMVGPFDATAAIASCSFIDAKENNMQIGRILYTSAHIGVMGVNANGLRTNRKKRLLRKLLLDLQVGIGVISETHLREEEMEGLKIKGYNCPAHYCRPNVDGVGIRGGVLILAHRSLTTEKLPKVEGGAAAD